MDKKAVIIIPHYNKWDLTHARLWELYKHEKDNIKYISVIDNGSTDSQTDGGLRWWGDFKTRTGFDIRADKIKNNIGFLRASNFGLQIHTTKNPDNPVILLSNDVIVRGKFIEQIVEVLQSNPLSLLGGVLHNQDTGWNTFGDKTFPYLEGWMLATLGKNWIDLNYFDTQFAPNDFEDVDLSTTALSKGYELVPLNNVNLQHLGGQTLGYSKEREEITNKNKKRFEEKWVS